jgi:hypothetical protein
MAIFDRKNLLKIMLFLRQKTVKNNVIFDGGREKYRLLLTNFPRRQVPSKIEKCR